MKTILEFIVKHKLHDEFNDVILKKSTHVIYIIKKQMTSDNINPTFEVKDIYILKCGNDTIGKEYGQPKYEDIFDMQDLDGEWQEYDGKFSNDLLKQNNVLKDFQDKTGIECCKKVNRARDNVYEVKFNTTDNLLKDLKTYKNVKIHNYSK